MSDSNYVSGDDYVVEFLGYRFGFNALDFEQRVNAAAVRLGLVGDEELDPGEIARWNVLARAEEPGKVQFQVQVKSDATQQPVLEREPTTLY